MDCQFFKFKKFIATLIHFLFSSLHLDSTFAKRNQTLLILTTFVDIIGARCSEEDNNNISSGSFIHHSHLLIKITSKEVQCSRIDESILFDLQEHVSRHELFTLVECLWDTYVDNKNLAMKLLFLIDQDVFAKYVIFIMNLAAH
jgi:hypothetical protein